MYKIGNLISTLINKHLFPLGQLIFENNCGRGYRYLGTGLATPNILIKTTMHRIPVFLWLQDQQNNQMPHGCIFQGLKEAFVGCYKTSILLKLILQDINDSLSRLENWTQTLALHAFWSNNHFKCGCNATGTGITFTIDSGVWEVF